MRAVPEHVGMAADHLLRRLAKDFIQAQGPLLSIEVGQKEEHEQQIAQLFGHMGGGAVVHRIHDLIGLLEDVALHGFRGLFAVPGTAVGPAKARYELNQPLKLYAGLSHGFLHSPSPGCPVRKHGEEWREATAT
jgi:hypothetical protein